MPKSPSSGSGNPRGRGKYNSACDVCARKKTKCDGNEPICEPCRQGGRAKQCTWTKNSVRKQRSEPRSEAMFKSLKKYALRLRNYTDYLESKLDKCTHQSGDFRSLRPPDSDGLLRDPPDHEPDLTSDDGNSDSGDGPAKELYSPTQSLQLKENRPLHYSIRTTPFQFQHADPPSSSAQPLRFTILSQSPNNTYVLLTDDVPNEHFNPDFDWSRHLPDIVPMDRRTHDKALDLLFKFFASWCLRIVPALFLRDMYRALCLPSSHPPPKTPHYSPMLHNALVAVALAFVDDPKLRDLKSRQYFVNKAKSYMETECSRPNPSLSVVNALSILASFYSSKGDQTLSYLNFGNSGRMAQVLGLNVDFSDWVKSNESDLLERRWTYWTTFTQDVCWSLHVGREFFMSSPRTSKAFEVISKPLVDDDYDQLPWVHPSSKLEPQPNYLTKSFQATCELLMNGRHIMDAVNRLDRSHTRPCVIGGLITTIDLNLRKWREGLPPELDLTYESQQTATPHKLMMHLAYWWLVILLHRPFFQHKERFIRDTGGSIDSVECCQEAAAKIMELLATWRTLYTLRYCPVDLIQIVYSAGTVHLLTEIQAKTDIRVAQKEFSHLQHKQKLILQYLDEIGKSWQCANIVAGILKKEQSEAQLHCQVALIPPSQSDALLAPEFAIDDDDGGSSSSFDSSKGRGRHHSSFIKRIHSRNYSLKESSNLSSTLYNHSLSLDDTTYRTQQDILSIARSSSPRHSIPIPIYAPQNGGSHFPPNSPSNLPLSFSRRSSLHHFNPFNRSSTSPLVASPITPYVTSAPSSDPASFSQYDTNLGGYGQVITHPLSALDELNFTGSGHTASHLFQQSSTLFNIPQQLGASHLSESSVHQFNHQDLSASADILGGGTLATGPVVRFNFTLEPQSPDLIFPFDSPQMSMDTDGFINYDSPAAFEDFPVNRHGDTAMNGGTM